MLPVREWGSRDYAESLEEMRSLRRARSLGEVPDTLVLVEHPPVITVGVQGCEGDALPDDLPVHTVERGGRSTYHGPGQLVGYPIIDLTPRGRDVRRYVRDLEEVLVRALASQSIVAGRVEGKRGVWVDGQRKIASIGIAVESWIAFHGFALNVATDLTVFQRFRPCGFEGAVMTSVSRELGQPVAVESLRPPVIAAFQAVFDGAIREPARAVAPIAVAGPSG
jgi:lipoate-protein ligase B